jgi:hypothetical protein
MKLTTMHLITQHTSSLYVFFRSFPAQGQLMPHCRGVGVTL